MIQYLEINQVRASNKKKNTAYYRKATEIFTQEAKYQKMIQRISIKKTVEIIGLFGAAHSGKTLFLEELHRNAKDIWFWQCYPHTPRYTKTGYQGGYRFKINIKKSVDSTSDWKFSPPIFIKTVSAFTHVFV